MYYYSVDCVPSVVVGASVVIVGGWMHAHARVRIHTFMGAWFVRIGYGQDRGRFGLE